jgi:hypothetical protein
MSQAVKPGQDPTSGDGGISDDTQLLRATSMALGAQSIAHRLMEDQPREVGAQEPHELLRSEWPAEVVALPLATPLVPKKCELLLRFDAFRDDPMPEAVAHVDHGANKGAAHRIGRDFLHERLIDLQDIDRKPL